MSNRFSSATKLNAQAILLVERVEMSGAEIKLFGPFVATPGGKQAPFRLLALLQGEPGEYRLAVDVVHSDGDRFISRKSEAHQHVDRNRMSYFTADFDDATLQAGTTAVFRVTCDGEVIGEATLTAV